MSLMEKPSSNDDKIAGRKPNNFLMTKKTEIKIAVAKIVFVRKIGTTLPGAKAEIIAKSVWKGG